MRLAEWVEGRRICAGTGVRRQPIPRHSPPWIRVHDDSPTIRLEDPDGCEAEEAIEQPRTVKAELDRLVIDDELPERTSGHSEEPGAPHRAGQDHSIPAAGIGAVHRHAGQSCSS